jgi:hypothetical protein
MNTLIKQNFSQCETCAYHEAGHILFAYLCGYSCRHVELINEKNEHGFSSIAIIDYGKDAAIAAKFIGSNPDSNYFKTLSLARKLECMEVGRRLARIFVGGSVAVAVFNNKGNVQIPLPLQIDYLDLLRAEFVHFVIKEISADQEEDFIEHNLQDALYTLANINIWNTIEDLGQRLLKNNQLDKNDIEECLEEHGLLYDKESPVDASFDF